MDVRCLSCDHKFQTKNRHIVRVQCSSCKKIGQIEPFNPLGERPAAAMESTTTSPELAALDELERIETPEPQKPEAIEQDDLTPFLNLTKNDLLRALAEKNKEILSLKTEQQATQPTTISSAEDELDKEFNKTYKVALQQSRLNMIARMGQTQPPNGVDNHSSGLSNVVAELVKGSGETQAVLLKAMLEQPRGENGSADKNIVEAFGAFREVYEEISKKGGKKFDWGSLAEKMIGGAEGIIENLTRPAPPQTAVSYIDEESGLPMSPEQVAEYGKKLRQEKTLDPNELREMAAGGIQLSNEQRQSLEETTAENIRESAVAGGNPGLVEKASPSPPSLSLNAKNPEKEEVKQNG